MRGQQIRAGLFIITPVHSHKGSTPWEAGNAAQEEHLDAMELSFRRRFSCGRRDSQSGCHPDLGQVFLMIYVNKKEEGGYDKVCRSVKMRDHPCL